jgi:hypothetical protein
VSCVYSTTLNSFFSLKIIVAESIYQLKYREIVFCRYGRYNTVRQLLDSEKGSFIINESDGEGLTPLHIASQQGKEG